MILQEKVFYSAIFFLFHLNVNYTHFKRWFYKYIYVNKYISFIPFWNLYYSIFKETRG